ncbi:hypothetical protein AB0B45_40925 [Nonomuraea sp. NPDC049152]|uniref:hypothetical protein n=1 Tax=Nonomuraea sp. NPDC049152 TaxID=3154350 RepID=UPI0033F342CF
MRTLKMLDVRSGHLIGTVSLDGEELIFSSDGMRSAFEGLAKAEGWSTREAFDRLTGWSNGYVQLMPEITVAQVYDGTRDGEPYFAPDHPIVDDPAERERLAAYLEAGAPILWTAALDGDRIDPARGAVVPLSFRTDGAWIWTDTVTYYLREHWIRPDPELVAHIAGRGYRWTEVDEAVTVHALKELYRFSG